MKILGISHIGLAPKDVAGSENFFQAILGLKNFGSEDVTDQKTRTTFFASNHDADNPTRLEILQDLADGNGPVGSFIAKKGGGIHHIALAVENVEEAIAFLLDKGVRMVDESPRDGAHQTKVAFVHPKSTGGLLVELVQEA